MSLPGPEDYGHVEYKREWNWPLIVGLALLAVILVFIFTKLQ